MREFDLTIRDAFVRGLRTERITARNVEVMEEMKNLRPTEYGAAFLKPFSNPGTLPATSWPYPQIFKGEQTTLLVTEQTIYTVNESTWAITAQPIYQIASLMTGGTASATIPTGGGAWQFAEFGKTWFLFKENCMVANLPSYDSYKLAVITSADNDFTCNAGCNFGNRLILGGITAATLLATDDWQDAFNAWIENSSEWSDAVTYEGMTLGKNMLMYSTRSGGAIDLPFAVEMAMLGFPAVDTATNRAHLKANYIDWIRRGEIGFIPLMHQGAVQHIKRLGHNFIAYCEDGVSLISPRDGKGFRETVLHGAGIASRNAVGGNHLRHVFLDTNSILWAINTDGSMERLVGTGTFDTMVANEADHPITCNYDAEEQEYYVCSDEQGFIRTRTGLAEITKLPTSLITASDGLVSPFHDLSSPNILLETETFDMGQKSLKTLHSIEVGYQDISSLQVKVKYRYDNSTTYRESSSYTVNDDGVCTPIFTAHDFRLELTGTPGSDAKIDYIIVRWQLSDKRAVRGMYV